MTTITTTANLIGHEARIEHLNKLTNAIESKIVEIKSFAGTHRYIFLNGGWQVLVK